MDDYPDLDDYYEEDYSKYEDKYADDLDMMDDMQQGMWRVAFQAIDMCQMDNIVLFVYFGSQKYYNIDYRFHSRNIDGFGNSNCL